MDSLHANGQRFVPIVQPVVRIRQGYQVYDSGVAADVFVKDVLGNPYVGQVGAALAPHQAALLCIFLSGAPWRLLGTPAQVDGLGHPSLCAAPGCVASAASCSTDCR